MSDFNALQMGTLSIDIKVDSIRLYLCVFNLVFLFSSKPTVPVIGLNLRSSKLFLNMFPNKKFVSKLPKFELFMYTLISSTAEKFKIMDKNW